MKSKGRQSLKLSGGYRGACFMILSTLFCMIENYYQKITFSVAYVQAIANLLVNILSYHYIIQY